MNILMKVKVTIKSLSTVFICKKIYSFRCLRVESCSQQFFRKWTTASRLTPIITFTLNILSTNEK